MNKNFASGFINFEFNNFQKNLKGLSTNQLNTCDLILKSFEERAFDSIDESFVSDCHKLSN